MAIVEILPPKRGPQGMDYAAAIYTDSGEHVVLHATVSEQLRRRMAAAASRAMAWAREHIRLPAGPMLDLMGGTAPDCGCDSVGEAFRAACLRAADLADAATAQGWALDGSELVWSFDDWDGTEASFLDDLSVMARDTFGAARLTSARPAMTGTRRAPVRAALGSPTGRAPVGTVTPGLAALREALRAVLGH